MYFQTVNYHCSRLNKGQCSEDETVVMAEELTSLRLYADLLRARLSGTVMQQQERLRHMTRRVSACLISQCFSMVIASYCVILTFNYLQHAASTLGLRFSCSRHSIWLARWLRSVSTEMGDRVQVQFPAPDIYFGM